MMATPTPRDKQKASRPSEPGRQKLSESPELARALLLCARTGIYIIQDGKFQYVNTLFQELTGYSEPELLGTHSLDLVYFEDREAVKEKALESLKNGGSLPYEYRFVKRNGEIIWVSEKATSTEYKGKQATLGSFTDITERKRLEETLRNSEARYRTMYWTMLEEIQDSCYFEADIAGNFTFVNDLMCRTLGYPKKEDLTGMNYRAFVDKEEVEVIYRDFNQVYRTGEPIKGLSYKFIGKGGSTIFGELSVSAIKNDEGEVIGFRGIARDITERKRLEQKLADMATHDHLTGLPNRLLLSDRLAVGLAQTQRNNTSLALMMLDLDRFKTVNDTFGHTVGDELLRAAGRRLLSLVRRSDTVARMGGDEFVVLLLQVAKMEDVIGVAQKIQGAFRKPFVLGPHQIRVTTSIGIAVYPEDGGDIETLFKNADTAMYWAKEQGRDNYELYWHNGTKSP
jgi:diguanylate cyclase (GGDEF)-like protein/PAS domain S-box-containing protein